MRRALKRMRDTELPLWLGALAVSISLHGLLLTAGSSSLRPELPAWGRLEVSLVAPGRADGRADGGAKMLAPGAVVSAAAPRMTAPESVARFGAAESAAPPALPLESGGDSLVLPSAVRAIYRAQDGSERQLVWRLTGTRYALQWSTGTGTAAVIESARGSLSWAGLLPLHYSRRSPAGEEPLEFDWSRQRSTDDAPIEAATVDSASLLMQLAISHQWLDAASRRVGWVLPVAGRGRVRVTEIDGDLGAPRYRIEWLAVSGVGDERPVELVLAPEHGFLPAAFRESGREGEREWRLVNVENLPLE